MTTNGEKKYSFHEVLEIWCAQTPHFDGVGPHRYTDTPYCLYCLRPKNFNPKLFGAEVA